MDNVIRVLLRHEDEAVAALCLDCQFASFGRNVDEARENVIQGLVRMIESHNKAGTYESEFRTNPTTELEAEFNSSVELHGSVRLLPGHTAHIAASCPQYVMFVVDGELAGAA